MPRMLVAALLVLAPALVSAQAHVHEDHGPPAEKLGTIDFPTSANADAHQRFVRGVALLHNFHYGPAAKAFRDAQALDSGDVMSYWGEALTYTHQVWNEQDTSRARAVLRRLAPTREARLAKARTPRERAWLDAVESLYGGDTPKPRRDSAYAESMRAIHAASPRDVEAAAFYTVALLGLNQGVRDSASYERAYLIADSLFIAHPDHPGAAHYLIHAVDDPAHARLGLKAARAYSGIAPSAGHALHMTSHIFIALGMWDEMVRANERANSLRPRVPGHSTHWLAYGLLQQGRFAAARTWFDTLVALEKTATTDAERDDARDGYALIAAEWIVDTHRYNEPIAWVRIDTARLGDDGARVLFARGLAALGRGERATADSMLIAMRAKRVADSTALAASGPVSAPDAVPFAYSRVMEQTLEALTLRADAHPAAALALLRAAAASEDTLPFAFGPPHTIKPPHEAAGELLLEMGRPAEAEREFQASLKRTPARPAVLLGLARAAKAQGHAAESRKRYAELAKIWAHADPRIAEVGEARRALR